jgi:hypothetical protein
MVLGPSSDPGEVEEALCTLPEVELLGVLRRSSNYTFLAELRRAPEDERALLAVYKPSSGESPLWDFPYGGLYLREVAAYRLSRQLGWPRIPPTVIREDAPHGVGALQLFIPARRGLHYLAARDQDPISWIQAAVFDVIVNNADRKSGHCLFDQQRRVWLIDHGLTFHPEHKLRTVIWDYAGTALPEDMRRDLEGCLASLEGGAPHSPLCELLGTRELKALRRRIEHVLAPDWRLPDASTSWSVPWPPV